MRKTLGELLDEGLTLQPIADTPFLHTAWRIGFYKNGVRHAAFRDRFTTKEECQAAIVGIMSQYREWGWKN